MLANNIAGNWMVLIFEITLTILLVWAILKHLLASRRKTAVRASIKRGSESFQNLSLAYLMLFGFGATLVVSAELPGTTKQVLHVANAGVCFYLAFLSPPFRNAVIRLVQYIRNEVES